MLVATGRNRRGKYGSKAPERLTPVSPSILCFSPILSPRLESHLTNVEKTENARAFRFNLGALMLGLSIRGFYTSSC